MSKGDRILSTAYEYLKYFE